MAKTSALLFFAALGILTATEGGSSVAVSPHLP